MRRRQVEAAQQAGVVVSEVGDAVGLAGVARLADIAVVRGQGTELFGEAAQLGGPVEMVAAQAVEE